MKVCPACHTKSEKKFMTSFRYTPTTLDKLKVFDERIILCCPNCNFGMIESDVDEELLEKYYSSDYAGKARKHSETKTKISDLRSKYSFDLRSISQLSLINQYIDIKSNLTVLEIGPGKGDFLYSLKQMNFNGNHIAFEPQEQAHKHLEDLGSNIEACNFNIDRAKKYTNSIDLVVMSHALEHFNPEKISEIFESINLMLKDGGIFFCEIPHANLIDYPNSGEMVVPHLSFFSIDAVKNFVKNSNMNLKFIDTCGVSQFSKDESKRIKELEELGHFTYDIDPDNPAILRNRNYHNYLHQERIKLKKKHKMINIGYSILGRKIFLLLLDLMRRFRQPSLSNLLSAKHFSYGKDKEYLRFIAQK